MFLFAAGCAKSAAPEVADLAQPRDAASNDDLTSAGDDLARADGPSSGDGGALDGGANDLASKDLSTPDLAPPRDLSTTSNDLATSPDLLAPPDMTPPCSVLPQSGCGAGEKCTLGATNTPTCVSNGNKQNGQQCGTAGSDDCVAGDLCTADAPSPAPATCRVFCSSDAQCTQPAVASGGMAEPGNIAHCAITITGTSDKVCTFACNPAPAAGASGCVAGQGCVYGGETGIPELTDCETPGTGTDNFNCASTADCAAGFACVGPAGMSRCRQVCRSGNTNDCTNINPLYDCFDPAGVTNPMFGFCCNFIAGC
ncbi:MAG TPA: hypothetical protein VFF06_11985 [Polyangia bacterium]|nr:hypothetical protein [Polyangia bacterium]